MDRIIETKNGKVKGFLKENWQCFLGIPFGEAPVGELRFQPPQPAKKWEGVLDATQDGVRPCQKIAPWVHDGESHTYGEDCLNLNVWMPDAPHEKLPVLVFIFGGGHMEGSNCEENMEAKNFMGDRPCIMVAPNYRVGALGYLYLEHLLGEKYASSGSLGTLDQILALLWVQENIEAFGGDPDNVTIMGQSAGGKSVSCLLATPLAKGLFKRAITMSGGLQCIKDIETEKKLTANFMQAAGITDAEELLTLSPEAIIAAQEKANETYFKAESYGPTADGAVFDKDLEKQLDALDLHGIDILMGGTANELYLNPGEDAKPFTDEEMTKRMHWKFGNNAQRVLDVYFDRKRAFGFEQAYNETVTEYTYIQQLYRTASIFAKAGANIHLYRWDYHDEGELAKHTSDLETAFRVRQPKDTAVGEHLRETLLTFIETGKVNWEPSTEDTFNRMALNSENTMLTFTKADIDEQFPLQVFTL